MSDRFARLRLVLTLHGFKMEGDFAGRSMSKIGVEMTIDFPHEAPPIAMSEPLGYLAERNTTHHANRGEVMTQVMESDPSATLQFSFIRWKVRHELVETNGGAHKPQRFS